jgi:hypothetical protein
MKDLNFVGIGGNGFSGIEGKNVNELGNEVKEVGMEMNEVEKVVRGESVIGEVGAWMGDGRILKKFNIMNREYIMNSIIYLMIVDIDYNEERKMFVIDYYGQDILLLKTGGFLDEEEYVSMLDVMGEKCMGRECFEFKEWENNDLVISCKLKEDWVVEYEDEYSEDEYNEYEEDELYLDEEGRYIIRLKEDDYRDKWKKF